MEEKSYNNVIKRHCKNEINIYMYKEVIAEF